MRDLVQFQGTRCERCNYSAAYGNHPCSHNHSSASFTQEVKLNYMVTLVVFVMLIDSQTHLVSVSLVRHVSVCFVQHRDLHV